MEIARAICLWGIQKTNIQSDIKPLFHNSFAEYKKHKGTSVNHFFEKLFLLKDKMNTKSGKELALARHNFMKNYINQFLKDWDLTLLSK